MSCDTMTYVEGTVVILSCGKVHTMLLDAGLNERA